MDYQDIPNLIWFFEWTHLTIGFVVNCVCLWYVLLKLKINVYVSRILVLAVSTTVVCQAANMVSLIFMSMLKTLSVAWCSMVILPKAIAALTAHIATMAIAVVRYYLASKTAKSEAPNHTMIKNFINFLCCLVTGYATLFALILTLSESQYVTPVIRACAHKKHAFEPATGLIILTILVSALIGLVNDIAMARFLKDRRRVKPIKMSVWASNVPFVVEPNPENNEQLSKLTIPVKATLIGGSILVLFLLHLGFLADSFRHESLSFSVASICFLQTFTFIYAVYLPFITLFTIKANEKTLKNSVKPIQPPLGLQFHGE